MPQVKTSSLPIEESLTKYVENLQIPSDIRQEVVKEALRILKEDKGR